MVPMHCIVFDFNYRIQLHRITHTYEYKLLTFCISNLVTTFKHKFPSYVLKITNSKMLEMQNATTAQNLKNIKAPKSETYGCHNNLAYISMNFMAEKYLTCLIYNCKKNHNVHFLNTAHGKLFCFSYCDLISMFSNCLFFVICLI
jgi:hypothetical protein